LLTRMRNCHSILRDNGSTVGYVGFRGCPVVLVASPQCGESCIHRRDYDMSIVNRFVFFSAALLLLSAGAVPETKADTVTFDDVVVVGTNPAFTSVTSVGFTFTSVTEHIVNMPGACATGCVSNGTQVLSEGGAADGGGPITMVRNGGGVFTLSGLDAGPAFIG